MAEMIEFGAGAQGGGVVPDGDQQSPTPAPASDTPEKKGGFAGLKGSLKKQSENLAQGIQNAAMAYVQDTGVVETGPWASPGEDWPHEWNKDKPFWYPLAKKGQFTQQAFPSRTNKTNHHSKGTSKWATTDNGTLLCTFARECPRTLCETFIGYLYPFSAAAVCLQRRQLLMNNPENYECCAGLLGAKWTTICNGCIGGNEECCMCMEAFFCPVCAMHANRWMVQAHYGAEDTLLDTVVIDWSILCRAPGECMCNCPECEEVATILYLPFLGCIYAQHAHEMRSRGFPYLGRLSGDLSMQYHSRVKGCGYDGKVIVKKTVPHPQDAEMA